MCRCLWLLVVVVISKLLAANPQAVAAPHAPIPLGETETVVFFGDSITQQNLYTAYIETFLISRFPRKQLLFWNAGVGGNTIDDALARFDRDVVPLRPTIVIVNFGMNDGKYVPPEAAIRAHYAAGLKQLLAKVAALGARPILCTPPAVNNHHALYLESYNATLAGLALEVEKLARDLAIPIIDLFTPFRSLAEQANPDPVLIPDGVHPNEAGHLLLAGPALARFGAPGPLGTVMVKAKNVVGNKQIGISNVTQQGARTRFSVELSHLPFYVPPDARVGSAARLYNGLNQFTLQIKDVGPGKVLRLLVDDQEVAVIPPHKSRHIDLASLERAPFNQASLQLWREAQRRFELHSTAWRTLGVDASAFTSLLPSTALARNGLHAWAQDAGLALRSLVAPSKYNFELQETDEVFVEFLELSPVYPYDLSAADFDTRHPPETTPNSVRWQREAVVDRTVDLAKALHHPTKTVVYARLLLNAQSGGDIDLQLGSNDGVTVFVNGAKVLARNVSRGLQLGDENLVVPLRKGLNTLLFRVTQHELRHGLALRLAARGNSRVVQASP